MSLLSGVTLLNVNAERYVTIKSNIFFKQRLKAICTTNIIFNITKLLGKTYLLLTNYIYVFPFFSLKLITVISFNHQKPDIVL